MANTITHTIDHAIESIPGVRSGAGAYGALIAEHKRNRGSSDARQKLIEGLVELAAARYRLDTSGEAELVEFDDRGLHFLFDLTLERTILVHSLSRKVTPNSRDNPYHKGSPRHEGFEKGHAMAHAQGGFEGGANYFPQRAKMNRAIAPMGKLWRAIEMHLASNAGLLAFVRLIYAKGDTGITPREVEYGLLNGPDQFRAVLFSNR